MCLCGRTFLAKSFGSTEKVRGVWSTFTIPQIHNRPVEDEVPLEREKLNSGSIVLEMMSSMVFPQRCPDPIFPNSNCDPLDLIKRDISPAPVIQSGCAG
jgi:hypothetical protein